VCAPSLADTDMAIASLRAPSSLTPKSTDFWIAV
jgi:hypothetical protein